MKVAILGNMNNNNFSLLRYLRDLNIDATLFLYKNDGSFFSSHFDYKSDTFEVEKWEKYIIRTEIIDSRSQIIGINFFLNIYLYISNKFFNLLSKGIVTKNSPSVFFIKKYLKKKLGGYDVIIGTGIAPSLFYLCDMKLDIYAPYAFGIEYFDCYETRNLIQSKNIVKKYIYKRLKQIQYMGLKKTKIINTQFGVTFETLKKNSLHFYPLDYPMVYLSENHLKLFDANNKSFNFLGEYDFVVLSHSRHIWINENSDEKNDWDLYENKHNNWLIESFTSIKKKYPKKKLLLILFEYGKDVKISKKLCKKLKIENSVIWCKKMDRKEILGLINKVDVVASEFYTGEGIMWGGCGWEALIMGKPLIVGFNFKKDNFVKNFGFPPPPILGVKNKKDILKHLEKLISKPKYTSKIGIESKEWFEEYNSYKAAKKWIKLF